MPIRSRVKSPLEAATLGRLDFLRTQLLRLHKVLLDDERAAYEKVHGPIGSAGRVLSLVMSDPWFDWLHKISQLIVKIDELQENENGTEALSEQLFSEAKDLILAKEPESAFSKAYRAALQRSSAAVGAHAEALKAIRDD
jgi:hypothetical protein